MACGLAGNAVDKAWVALWSDFPLNDLHKFVFDLIIDLAHQFPPSMVVLVVLWSLLWRRSCYDAFAEQLGEALPLW